MAEVLFRRLMEQTSALFCVKDANGRYAYANNSFIQAFDIGGRFAPGVVDQDIFPEELARRLSRHDALARESSGPRIDQEAFAINGQERAFLFSRVRLTAEDGRDCLGIVALEVAGPVQAEEDLVASRALFKGILDIAVDAIVSVDEAQRIVLFNQGAEKIFGYAADEVMGQPLDMLLPQAARAMHQHHFAQFAKSGKEARQMGERGGISGRRKDGGVFPAEASISQVRLGERITYTAILRDVTEARNAESAIKALNADLKHRATQLENANRELEAFSYSVSHDLRAPLRSIDGFSQVLIEDFFDSLPAEAQDSLQRIRGASQRMAQLIDDMLALSRFTRGAIVRSEVDLSAMVAAIAEDLRLVEPARQVTFDVKSGVTANADPHLIQVVLTNLVGNAWKYTSKHEAARIQFGKFADSHGRAVYFVRDDGAGFDMAYANKLFGVFQRLHAMDEYAGSGVGLATVQRIIHKHGGEVWAEGAINQGATFYFTLN